MLWRIIKGLERAFEVEARFQIVNISVLLFNVWWFFHETIKIYNRLFFGKSPSLPPAVLALLLPAAVLTALLFIYLVYSRNSNSIIVAFTGIIAAGQLLVDVVMQYAEAYKIFGLIASNGAQTHDPATCLYFSMITWTTVGYGDFVPTPDDRLIAASEAFVGYFAALIFVAIAVNVIHQPWGRKSKKIDQ